MYVACVYGDINIAAMLFLPNVSIWKSFKLLEAW
jgi:hypothetical protein